MAKKYPKLLGQAESLDTLRKHVDSHLLFHNPAPTELNAVESQKQSSRRLLQEKFYSSL